MKRYILFAAFILFIPLSLPAGERHDFIRSQKSFIRELYSEHRYFDAIAEAGRLKVYRDTPELDYFVLLNYYLAGQYRTAIRLSPANTGDKAAPADFIRAMSYLKLEKYNESSEALEAFRYHEADPLNFDLFRRRVEPLLLSGRLEETGVEGTEAAPFLRGNMIFAGLREELERYRGIGLKSPAGAAIMSAAVPGLGQVYSGYPAEGLISLASVAVTALGSAWMYSRGDKGASCTLGFFSALFYAGNIYGGYNSADRRNRDTLGGWYRAINEKYGEYNPESYMDAVRLFE